MGVQHAMFQTNSRHLNLLEEITEIDDIIEVNRHRKGIDRICIQ
jgi:hypothetical protein